MTYRQECKAWTLISVGALAIAGVFALLLVFSRTPVLQDFLPWPWKSFFHKGLVTHVVFSFVVWFLATMGALFSYEIGVKKGPQQRSRLGPIAIGLAFCGAIGLILPALLDLGTAELNNYVPVMTHFLYYAGLVLLLVALALVSLRQIALKSTGSICAYMYLLACLCFVLAYFLIDPVLAEPTYNEFLFWGSGHILQFVNTALLILVWAAILSRQTNASYIPKAYEWAALIILALFATSGPFVYFLFDIVGQHHRDFFTELLRYGLVLPSLIASFFLGLFLLSSRATELDSLSRTALWLSLLTYNIGGMFALFLDGTDTRVPAHYHAVIGGINLAFMVFYHRVVLPYIFAPPKEGCLLHLQYWLYGLGQIFHASGMFIAGWQGVPRKTAGAAQSLDSLEKIASMGLMGVGGIIAVAGGVLFVVMTLRWITQGGRIHEMS